MRNKVIHCETGAKVLSETKANALTNKTLLRRMDVPA